MNIIAKGTITYECTLTPEDEQKVIQFSKENNISLLEAVRYLQNLCEINIYEDSTDSEYKTDNIEISEFESGNYGYMDSESPYLKVFSEINYVASLEEACRQWCEFINNCPERRTGIGFYKFFREISAQSNNYD